MKNVKILIKKIKSEEDGCLLHKNSIKFVVEFLFNHKASMAACYSHTYKYDCGHTDCDDDDYKVVLSQSNNIAIDECNFKHSELLYTKSARQEFIELLLSSTGDIMVQYYPPNIFYFSFEIENKVKEVCEECAHFYNERGIYEEKDKVDTLFNTMILSHGVSAYNALNSADEIISRIEDVEKHHEWQICCSNKTQPIGAVGIYVMGHNHYVSNVDLCSELNEKGDRVFDIDSHRATRGIITSRGDYSLDEWDHTEHVVSKTKIKALWVKEWALKSIPSLEGELQKYADEKHLRIFILKNRKRG